MKNKHYYIGLSHCLGIGPVRFQKLIAHYKDVKKAYEADLKELTELIGPKTAQGFVDFRQKFDLAQKEKEIRQKGIVIVAQEDKNYPKSLINIPDPPICFYVKGNINEFDFEKSFMFAVVGTRKPSSYGQQIAKLISCQLIEAGATLVSGMALGIDTIAHQTSVDYKQKTIAVLGCGVDIVYPPANKKLYNEIIECGGLIISEFPPGHTVEPGLFVARNRLISGLSRGILVVEGTKESGALITARYGAIQGKDVFAPPVPLTSYLSEAPNILLKQGAIFTTSAKDILAEYNMKTGKPVSIDKEQLSKEEIIIYEHLSKQVCSPDELSILSNIPISSLLPLLSMMEVKNIIKRSDDGSYQLQL